MTSVNSKHQIRKEAIERALEALGPRAKSIVLTYLSRQKKITVESSYCSPIEEIEASLEELFGDGAALIIDSIATRELNSS
jgi:hypothetical protein